MTDLPQGFYIERMSVVGPGVVAAEVDFEDGLNVVAGASDTGKSYLCSLVDFVFGASTPPRVLEQAKGYRATKNSSYKRAKEQVQRSGQYAYRDRRVRKREFRRLWIIRINAGARENGLSYNQFMHGLELAQVELDRKILAELAVSDPKYFASLVDQARAALEAA